MSWGTVRDNLQKENSNDKYKLLTSGKGYFIRINISQRNCDPVWENHKSHHNIIYHSTDHVTEKKDREVREPHITLIQISLIYKSCLLYYNKWFIAHASFLKGEAYFRLRISRIFAMFVKSKSNCPVNNKTKKKLQ